jgi:hypothetical protein
MYHHTLLEKRLHGVSRGNILSDGKIVDHTTIWQVVIVSVIYLQTPVFRFLPVRQA